MNDKSMIVCSVKCTLLYSRPVCVLYIQFNVFKVSRDAFSFM